MSTAQAGAQTRPSIPRPEDSVAAPWPLLAAVASNGDLPIAQRRDKQVGYGVRLAYLTMRVARRLLGTRRVLRACLNLAWLSRRFAWELSTESYGDEFGTLARAVSESTFREWIPAGASVVDIGCGAGQWSALAGRYAGHVLGVDRHEPFIEGARRRVSAANVEFMVGQIPRDLAGRRFDVALLIHILEHVDEAERFLRELRATAARVIVEVPDLHADGLNPVREALHCPFYSDGDHVSEYTERSLSLQLERAGWLVRSCQTLRGALLVVADAARHEGGHDRPQA